MINVCAHPIAEPERLSTTPTPAMRQPANPNVFPTVAATAARAKCAQPTVAPARALRTATATNLVPTTPAIPQPANGHVLRTDVLAMHLERTSCAGPNVNGSVRQIVAATYCPPNSATRRHAKASVLRTATRSALDLEPATLTRVLASASKTPPAPLASPSTTLLAHVFVMLKLWHVRRPTTPTSRLVPVRVVATKAGPLTATTVVQAKFAKQERVRA